MAYFKNAILTKLIVITIFFSLLCDYVQAVPMLYKKNIENKYEADLVPVSSTVIPTYIDGSDDEKPSEELKIAYLKKLQKKMLSSIAESSTEPSPDSLITLKTKNQNDKKSEANKPEIEEIVAST